MQYKLICFDLDGVIFKPRNFWNQLHKAYGTESEGKTLTDTYLLSDYQKLVDEVVGRLWKGKDAGPYLELVSSLEYMHGVSQVFEVVKRKGYITAIISGSSLDAARRAQSDFGVDYIFANDIEIREGKISGIFTWQVGYGGLKKAEVLQDICEKLNIGFSECIYVGDSENDIEAFKKAGLTIAFNPDSEELRSIAKYVIISDTLADILPCLL